MERLSRSNLFALTQRNVSSSGIRASRVSRLPAHRGTESGHSSAHIFRSKNHQVFAVFQRLMPTMRLRAGTRRVSPFLAISRWIEGQDRIVHYLPWILLGFVSWIKSLARAVYDKFTCHAYLIGSYRLCHRIHDNKLSSHVKIFVCFMR